MGVWLAEMNLVILDTISSQPFQGSGSLSSHHLADIAATRFHVSRRGNDDVMTGLRSDRSLATAPGTGSIPDTFLQASEAHRSLRPIDTDFAISPTCVSGNEGLAPGPH